MKVAACSEGFGNVSIEDAILMAAEIGYDGIEIAPHQEKDAGLVTDTSNLGRAYIVKVAKQRGIEVVGLHWILSVNEKQAGSLGFFPHIMGYSTQTGRYDRGIHDATKLYMRELIKFCHDIGRKIMVHGSPKQRNIPYSANLNIDPKEAEKHAIEFYEDVLDTAKSLEVKILLEPLVRFGMLHGETNWITSPQEAVELTRKVDRSNLGYMLDTKAELLGGREIVESIGEYPNLGHFHANDSNLRCPGFGRVAFTPILAALGYIGYQGWVSVEAFRFSGDSKEERKQDVRRSLQYLKNCNRNGRL